MTTPMQTREITAIAAAFTGEGVRSYRFQVDADGTVRVYDSVAGHYTLTHALSEGAQKRIRRLARS